MWSGRAESLWTAGPGVSNVVLNGVQTSRIVGSRSEYAGEVLELGSRLPIVGRASEPAKEPRPVIADPSLCLDHLNPWIS